MTRYYESVRLWGAVLRQRVQPVPGKPGCAYYGEGGHLENDVRPLAYAALVNAFLGTKWLSLVGEQSPAAVPANSDWACVVAFPNQKKAQTRKQADAVVFQVDGDNAVCRIGAEVIRANLSFGDSPRP